ncbi:MAG: hypothetical protein FJ206_13605 [Gemmatimonadetes bacterium]|nr:hypothetical protein [Gemmatimonadota bacterium]
MIANVLVAVGLGAAVSAVAAAAGDVALRQAREVFLGVRGRAAASAAVASELRGVWLDSTAIVGPGRTVVIGPVPRPRADTEVRLDARWLARDLWLLSATATIQDVGGQTRARAVNGIIVQVLVSPIDSTYFTRPISRGWVAGYQ